MVAVAAYLAGALSMFLLFRYRCPERGSLGQGRGGGAFFGRTSETAARESSCAARLQDRFSFEKIVEVVSDKENFLNPDFKVTDLAYLLHTNKKYVERVLASSHGASFPMMVNYFRICHAVALFLDNPDLRVNELAYKSGYNSPNTFTVNFKLFMNCSPREWCMSNYNRNCTLDKSPPGQEEKKMVPPPPWTGRDR